MMMILNRLFLEDEWDQFSEVMSLIIDDLLNREEQRKPPANVELTEGWASKVNSGLCRTCLLYTSPSPRDLSTSRMPSSA